MAFLQYCYHRLRISARLLRSNLGEVGALSAEYVGILLVVAAIVVALLGAGIQTRVAAGAQKALCEMKMPLEGKTCPK